MTRLLVSVRDAQEAELAAAAGAAIIDVKEPWRGALGAALPEVWRAVRAAVPLATPVSVALGELQAPADVRPEQLAGIRYVKLGLAGCREEPGWRDSWQAFWEPLRGMVEPVAVAYADHRRAASPAPADVLAHAAAAGCRTFLLDTFDKSRGDLFASVSPEHLRRLVKQARSSGLMTVVAGSLNEATLPAARAAQPDYLGVRGAVCGGSRTGSLCADRVRALCRLLRDRDRAEAGVS